MEEGFLAKDHRSEHSAQAPHVQAIVIFLEINQEFWTFEIARRDTDIVFRAGMIELCKTPIDEAQLCDRLARYPIQRTDKKLMRTFLFSWSIITL